MSKRYAKPKFNKLNKIIKRINRPLAPTKSIDH